MKLSISALIIIGLLFLPVQGWAEEVVDSSYETAVLFNPIALDAGELSPESGLLIDERTAEELVLLRASDLRLSTELEVRQRLWTEQQTIYENALTSLQGQVETLMEDLAGQEPSWWNRYGGVVLGTVGFVVGAVVTILVAWAVAEAVSPNTVQTE